MDYYKKTQYGSVIVGFCLLPLGVIYSFDGPSEEFLFSLLIIAAVISVFGYLTVIIDKTQLKIRMGIGLFRKTIPLNDITETRTTKIPWWIGWGFRYHLGRMIFNVQGFKGVEVFLKNNQVVVIGSAEPELLKQKLDSARGLFQS